MECPSCEHPNVDNARFCAKCGALLPVKESAEDPMLGVVIKNTFRVMRLLGEGGMGRVYEGEQQMGTTTRKVAIKTLHPHLSRDPQIVARFNRECGTVAELEHANTIQFFDFGQAPDGTLFIAMEFIHGESICEIVERDGPMDPVRVEKIIRQVCGSLAEAHKKGIVHRDLKPDNVVLTTRAGEKDFAKVLDFGIAARTEAADAKKEQKLTQQGTVLGTPPYMSPEQFTGKELDGRSDIYSLGVMAYEMLTGKLPFEADTPWEWATKHLTERPYPFEVTAPRSAMIPDAMKLAIMKSLAKNVGDRQPDVMVFYNELAGNNGPAGAFAGAGMGAPAGAPGTGTAAMAAPPPGMLQAGPPHQAYGAPAGRGGGAPPTANEMIVPIQAPAYAPPSARKSGGGGAKFAILGIVALLFVAGIGGVIFAARGMGGDDDSGDMNLGTLASATGVAEIAPLASAGGGSEDGVGAATAVVVDASKAVADNTKPKSTAPAPTPTSTKPKGPTGEEACQKSIQLARQGAIESAVAYYHQCGIGGSSAARAKAAIRSNAKSAAQQAKFRGDCGRANSIASSARSIGADGGASSVAASCK